MKELDLGMLSLLLLTLLFFNLMSLAVVTVYARGKIDKLLCGCSVVVDNKVTLGGLGLMGDIIRVGVAGSLMLFPKAYFRKTKVDEKQVKAFPIKLKYMIVVQWLLLIVIMSSLVVLSIWIKS